MSFKWARHEGAFRLFQFEKDCRPSHRGGGGAHIPIDSSLHTFLARRNRGRSFFRAEGFSFSWDLRSFAVNLKAKFFKSGNQKIFITKIFFSNILDILSNKLKSLRL